MKTLKAVDAENESVSAAFFLCVAVAKMSWHF